MPTPKKQSNVSLNPQCESLFKKCNDRPPLIELEHSREIPTSMENLSCSLDRLEGLVCRLDALTAKARSTPATMNPTENSDMCSAIGSGIDNMCRRVHSICCYIEQISEGLEL